MENPLEETTEQAEQEELAETADQVSKALRGPKYGIFQQLICQHLIQATVTTDPLRKIQLVTDAALMQEPEKQKALGLDMDKLEIVKKICDALQHKTSTKLKNYVRPLISVKWGFDYTQKNFEKYVAVWLNDAKLNYHSRHIQSKKGKHYRIAECRRCGNEVYDSIRGKFGLDNSDKCKFCGGNLRHNNFDNPYPLQFYIGFEWDKDVIEAERFFATSEVLTDDGYATVETNFLSWANAFIMDTMRRLTEAVRPEIYNQIMKMMVKPTEAKK